MLPNRRKLKRPSRHRTVVAGYQQRIFNFNKTLCGVAFTGGLFGTDTENFTLDAVGNRLAHSKVSGAWVYDANNRLTQRGTGASASTYQYDDAGNLTLKTEAGKTTQYSYDTQNRLIEVQIGSNTSNAQASVQSKLIARYGYDPLDRRIWKEQYKSADGQALAQAVRTYYLYADEGLITESTQAITLNADGSVTAGAAPQITTQYGPRPGSDFTTGVLFVKTNNSNGQASFAYLHHDHLQTPLQATDKAGNVVWAASYNAFGKAVITTPAATAEKPTIKVNLRLPGQYWDEETGLHYNWHRYYDVETGRYTQGDPIGLRGGPNPFAYVEGNPLSRVDPTGQFAMVIPFIPAIITGTDLAIGAGLGALGYGLDRMFNVPARGLPPEGINPPTDGQCKPGPASRPSERDKGGQSLWDPTGGEWRWSPGDKWHNPHWDQNPHDRPSSPWVNVPHGGLPPVKQ
jgi:RHS repeat-associated protein